MFTLSEYEHLRLREIDMWLSTKGDITRAGKEELHGVLGYILHRFEGGLKDGSVEYMSARELLKSQLEESLMQAAE